MTTTVLIRHRCDRCATEVELEYVQEQPNMPPGWRVVGAGVEPMPLLCASCADTLAAWLRMKPETKAH
jgi:hypothetical protein